MVLLVSLFLPWFTASAGLLGSTSESGITAHNYLWLVFLLCVGIIAVVVLGAGLTQMPLPLPRETILLVATGLNLLIALLAFLMLPDGFRLVTISWAFGAFISLTAAIAACVSLAMPALRAQSRR